MKLLLYDGTCNLCHWAVQWIKRNAGSTTFQFESLSSDFAKKLIEKHSELEGIDSIIFFDEKGMYIKSEAIFHISSSLKRPWPLLQLFRIFPKSMLDQVYSFIAKNRKKWFGSNNSCEL